MSSPIYSYTFNVKVQKHPCIFYDALIRSKIEQLIANNIPGVGFLPPVPNIRKDSYEYYKDVYDDKYGKIPPDKINYDDISKFFHDKTKFDSNYAFSIKSPREGRSAENNENFINVRFKKALTKYINKDHYNKLFVIPILIDDENYTESNQQRISRILSQGSKYIKPPLTGGQGNTNPIYYFEPEEDFDNVYLLPCLLTKGSKTTEDEYVKILKVELLRLQEHIQERFNKKRQKQEKQEKEEKEEEKDEIKGIEEIELFTDIVFFYNPNGKISLRFYTEIELKKISKEGEDFLNKHLFKELKNVRGRKYEGKPQFDVDERVYSQPIFRKNKILTTGDDKNVKINSFLEFLYRTIYELEILISNFTFIGASQFSGIRNFKIIYNYKLSIDLNDFKPKAYSKDFFTFTHTSSQDNIYRDLDKLKFKLSYDSLDETDKSRGYFKITDIKYESSEQPLRNIPQLLSEREHYLKFLPSDLLKFVVIYTRPKNMFTEKMRGILQLSKSSEIFAALTPSQLSRSVAGKKFYYYENLDFTMDNFKRFAKNRASKKISKDELRDLLIKTFSDRTLLKDYFMFCTDDRTGKKDIKDDFYSLQDEKKKEEWRNHVVKKLTKEFIKKGSKFWVNEKDTTIHYSNGVNTKKGAGNYNKYIVKNIKKGLTVGTNSEVMSEVMSKLPQDSSSAKKVKQLEMDDHGKQLEYASVSINLKKDEKDKSNANADNNGELEEAGVFGELITTMSSDKCNKRKKTLKKRFSKLAKNIKGKAIYHALVFGSKLKNATRRRNIRNPAP